MGRNTKKPQYERKAYETRKPGKPTGEPFAAIYASMIGSEAWEALTNNAKVLYIYMKLQLFGNRKDHLPEGQFYFNRATYSKTYNLYKNQTQFYVDKDLLIKYGFIDEIENGKTTRTKNIYQFSDRWQSIDISEIQRELEQEKEDKKEKEKRNIEAIRQYREQNPNATLEDCYIDTGIHKGTIKKWWDK